MTKRIIKHSIYSLLATIACSTIYTFPDLDKHETSVYNFVNGVQILGKGINGYGIIWALMAVLFFCLFQKTDELKDNKPVCFQCLLAILSLIFGIVNTAGLYMFNADALPFGQGFANLVVAIIAVIGWSILFFTAAVWTLHGFSKAYDNASGGISDKKLFLISFSTILFCWLPWIIAYYPASMDNDVFHQLDTALGYIERSNHHPWFASVVLASCYRIGSALISDNAGIFLYVILRDILMALIYARGIVLIRRSGIRQHIVYIFILFYSITPVWGAYAKHAFKDTFAAGLFCWFIISFCIALKKEKTGTDTILTWLEVGISATMASLFRNNVIYAVFPAVLLIVFYLTTRKKMSKAGLVLLLSLLYFGYNRYIVTYEGVKPGSKVEALSIPFQQTARVVAKHREELTEHEIEELSNYWDVDNLAEVYNPILSDPVKGSFRIRNKQLHMKDYLVLWLKMFSRYPQDYFEAGIAQSYGYYAFTPKRAYWEGNWNSNMVIFDWIGTGHYPFEGYFDFHYIDSLEFPRRMLHVWPDLWDRIPVLNLTDIIAAYTWMVVLIGFYLVQKRRWMDLIPVFSCLLLTMTCMASPVNDCFRYFAPVAVSLPVLFCLLPSSRSGKA